MGKGGIVTIKSLLVDDERSLLDQAEIFLERINSDIDVSTVPSAEKALDVIDENDFDVIVSDYQMPDIDGLEFLEELREEKDSDIPFIMFTGKGREEVAMKALNLGANRYIQKGGDPSAQYSVLAQAIEQEVEHHHTELNLEKSEKRYRKLVETTGDIIIKHDEKGRVEFTNQAGLDFTGYSEEDVKGKNITDFLPKDQIPDLLERKKKRLEEESRDRFNFQTKFINKDGERIDVDVEATPLFEEDEYKGDLVIARDITDLKRSKQKLKESEERYRRLFETAQDGMLIIDAETGEIEDANPFIQNILGYSKEELVGKKLWELGTFESIVDNKRRFEELVDEGYIRYEDKPLESKEGEEVPVEFVSNTYEAGGKKVVQCNIRETSARKIALENLKEKNEEIQWMLDSMMNAFVLFESVFDEDGNFVNYRFVYINKAYEEMTGVKLEDVKGKTVDEVWPKTEQEWIDRYGEVAVTGESQTFDLYHEPTDKTYHCTVYRPYDTKEKFCVIFKDLSEKEEKEQKLRKEREKFRKIFNNANDAIYLHELTEDGMPGSFIEVNDTATEMLGYSREEFLKMSPAEIDAAEKANEIPDVMSELTDEGEVKFEMVHQAKDGTKIPIEIHSHLFELEGKKRVLSIARDISDRKEFERKLTESERKFRRIFEASPDPTFLLDKEGVFTDVNDTALKKLGYDKEEIVGKELEELPFLEEEAVGKTVKNFLKRMDGEEVPPYEIEMISRDGDILNAEINAKTFMEEEFKGEVVIARDITERKEAEEKLRESERRLNLALKGAELGVWDWNVKTDEVRYSEKWAEMLGYSCEEIEHDLDSWEKRVHPDERSWVKEELEEHLDGKRDIFKTEHRMKTKSGDWIWVKDVGKVFERDENDEPIRATGVLEDITDRKEVEKKLKESEKKYKQLSEELESILDHLPGLVYYKDTENNFIKVNKRLAEAHDMSKEEMEGKSLFDLYPEEEAQKYLEDDIEVIENREPKLNVIERWSPDEEKWMSTSKIPYIVDGEVKGIIGISIDVTEEKKNRERVEFLHTILRHDIKNKVQVVHGYLQLLEEEELPSDAENFLNKALEGSKQSMNLMDKIRLLLKAQEEVKKSVKIAETVYDAVEETESLAQDKGMELSVQCPSMECEVKGGPLLKEVFSNIIENSVYHSGGDEVKISGDIKEDEVICTIEDDGKGIPDDKKKTIFDKGYTTDEKRGTGLGMFLVKMLVDTYGGEIEVKDSEMGGARFDIHLKKVQQ